MKCALVLIILLSSDFSFRNSVCVSSSGSLAYALFNYWIFCSRLFSKSFFSYIMSRI